MKLQIAEGAVLLPGFARESAETLVAAIEDVVARAPFRHMTVPGGHKMSVAMTNCGEAGWVSDRSGYRYERLDPETGNRWPDMPESFADVAMRGALLAGYDGFCPDVCLINRYQPGARMALHQDKDERDFTAPIVSVSLGAPAIFLFGGLSRKDRPRRIRLHHGDVVAWGGEARMAYHGIAPVGAGQRVNLTFRKAF